MKFTVATLLALGLSACAVSAKQEQTRTMTIRQTCEERVAAEAYYMDVRFKSLPGYYGVTRIDAERAVSYWAQYCKDEHLAVYRQEQAQK